MRVKCSTKVSFASNTSIFRFDKGENTVPLLHRFFPLPMDGGPAVCSVVNVEAPHKVASGERFMVLAALNPDGLLFNVEFRLSPDRLTTSTSSPCAELLWLSPVSDIPCEFHAFEGTRFMSQPPSPSLQSTALLMPVFSSPKLCESVFSIERGTCVEDPLCAEPEQSSSKARLSSADGLRREVHDCPV